MEIQMRRHRPAQILDQENIHAIKGKVGAVPIKKTGLGSRGALGDINTNVQTQREIIGKVAVVAAEYEKKTTLNRAAVRSNYNHVQSKVDTGLAVKSTGVPSSRPPLRREESTAGLAARAAARNKAILKDAQNKPTDLKDTLNVYIQSKKTQDSKKSSKLPTLKENKELLSMKPTLKESTESLGKLKLAEGLQQTSIIDKKKVQAFSFIDDDLNITPLLPHGIEDIDAKDNNSPLLMPYYIKDIYRYLCELEEMYPIEADHLRNQSVITGKMRATLIDWLVEVQHQFSLMLETFQLTVGIIDRYLQAVPNIQRNRIQLIGVTAMYIASKYEEIYAPEVGDFVYVTDNAYTKKDVFQCEIDILSKLGYCLARPIPLSFLRRFIKVAHGTSKNHHLAKYFVDLCLVEYTMSHYRPSELASAAICLSLYLLSDKDLSDVWTPALCYYSGYTLKQITPIIRKLAKIVINVENSKNKAVYKKYLDTSLAKVSGLPQLRCEAIYKLASYMSSD